MNRHDVADDSSAVDASLVPTALRQESRVQFVHTGRVAPASKWRNRNLVAEI